MMKKNRGFAAVGFALLMAVTLLTACAGFDAEGNPKPIWLVEPSANPAPGAMFNGVCLGSACPGVSNWSSPGLSAFHDATFSGRGALGTSPLPQLTLYREDPDEKPIAVENIETGPGKFVATKIYRDRCYVNKHTGAVSPGVNDQGDILLCRSRSAATREHEKDHVRGLVHTEAESDGHTACWRVKAPGYKTAYVVGRMYCHTDSYQWAEK